MSRAVAISLQPSASLCRLSNTTRAGCGPDHPGSRTVSSGSSASAVSTPTSTASCSERSRCTASRASGPVIQRLSPVAVAIRPSSEVASLRVTLALILGGLAQALLAEEGRELAGLAEVAIDRGVADIGHVIEALELLHDQFADHGRGEFGLAHALKLAGDQRDHPLDALGLDGPLAGGDGEGAGQLVALEGRAPARPLEDRQLSQLHPLEGGEAAAALRTEAAAADGRAVFRRAAVLHLAFGVAAEGAR